MLTQCCKQKEVWRRKIRLKEQENDGYDEYPRSTQEAYERLVQASGDVKFKNKVKGNRFCRGPPHVSFFQNKNDNEELVKGTDGKLWPGTKCYKCTKWGHTSTPETPHTGHQSMQSGSNFIKTIIKNSML